jgi:hypothetical protein
MSSNPPSPATTPACTETRHVFVSRAFICVCGKLDCTGEEVTEVAPPASDAPAPPRETADEIIDRIDSPLWRFRAQATEDAELLDAPLTFRTVTSDLPLTMSGREWLRALSAASPAQEATPPRKLIVIDPFAEETFGPACRPDCGGVFANGECSRCGSHCPPRAAPTPEATAAHEGPFTNDRLHAIGQQVRSAVNGAPEATGAPEPPQPIYLDALSTWQDALLLLRRHCSASTRNADAAVALIEATVAALTAERAELAARVEALEEGNWPFEWEVATRERNRRKVAEDALRGLTAERGAREQNNAGGSTGNDQTQAPQTRGKDQ